MRHLVLTTLIVFLFACGKSKEPAKIIGLENFSSAQQEQIKEAVGILNQKAGAPLFLFEGGGYPVMLGVSKDLSADNRLGHARNELSGCNIEFSQPMVDDKNPDLFRSVIWHELAHCLGLSHDSGSHEIMSVISYPISNYSTGEVDRFIQRILSSVEIH